MVLNPENRSDAITEIRGIRLGSGTNIGAALYGAYNMLDVVTNSVQAVVFMTDGRPTRSNNGEPLLYAC